MIFPEATCYITFHYLVFEVLWSNVKILMIIEELDKILIEVAISDLTGQKFWSERFLTLEYVEFDIFMKEFIQFTKLPQPDSICIACFKILLTSTENLNSEPENIVKIVNFGNFLKFFGPITKTRIVNGNEEIISIFERVGFLSFFLFFLLFVC